MAEALQGATIRITILVAEGEEGDIRDTKTLGVATLAMIGTERGALIKWKAVAVVIHLTRK